MQRHHIISLIAVVIVLAIVAFLWMHLSTSTTPSEDHTQKMAPQALLDIRAAPTGSGPKHSLYASNTSEIAA